MVLKCNQKRLMLDLFPNWSQDNIDYIKKALSISQKSKNDLKTLCFLLKQQMDFKQAFEEFVPNFLKEKELQHFFNNCEFTELQNDDPVDTDSKLFQGRLLIVLSGAVQIFISQEKNSQNLTKNILEKSQNLKIEIQNKKLINKLDKDDCDIIASYQKNPKKSEKFNVLITEIEIKYPNFQKNSNFSDSKKILVPNSSRISRKCRKLTPAQNYHTQFSNNLKQSKLNVLDEKKTFESNLNNPVHKKYQFTEAFQKNAEKFGDFNFMIKKGQSIPFNMETENRKDNSVLLAVGNTKILSVKVSVLEKCVSEKKRLKCLIIDSLIYKSLKLGFFPSSIIFQRIIKNVKVI